MNIYDRDSLVFDAPMQDHQFLLSMLVRRVGTKRGDIALADVKWERTGTGVRYQLKFSSHYCSTRHDLDLSFLLPWLEDQDDQRTPSGD